MKAGASGPPPAGAREYLKPMTNWKDVPGHEGSYQVSDAGDVRSLDRDVFFAASHKSRAYARSTKGRMLRPGRMSSGHVSVALGRNNSRCVHELVLLAFVGPPPEGHECRHLNGNPADNRLENLRWGTRSENIRDAVSHGTWMTDARVAGLNKGRATRWGNR